jgi:hypothetical protein
METDNIAPALRERLGRDATDGLLQLLETTRHEWLAEVTAVTIARFERRLNEAANGLRSDIHEMTGLMRRLDGQLQHLDEARRQEMSSLRADWPKWALLFWTGHVAATAAIVGGMLALLSG